ncbi:MAG: tryptophan-rich sensory protein [Pseudomonadota bacterium]|nr:tryptophan-rich sensory protein [Pseudomonadota bacterium]
MTALQRSGAASLFGLIGWLFVTVVAGGVGAVASINAVDFYGSLTQPPWAPPAWLFGPVWTLLYLIMAVAAWLVWRRHGLRGARTALVLYGLQLVANALWTWLFFAWHRGAWSMIEVAVLWILIVATIAAFWRLQRVAAVLLLPYLAWVSFASALTWAMWRLNPAVLG